MRMAAVKARDDAQRALKEKVRSGFQHIVYLSQPEPHMPRTLAIETLDNDLQTALDGTTVWKVLVAWAEGTLTVIVDDTKSDELVQSLKAMGISPVVKDQ